MAFDASTTAIDLVCLCATSRRRGPQCETLIRTIRTRSLAPLDYPSVTDGTSRSFDHGGSEFYRGRSSSYFEGLLQFSWPIQVSISLCRAQCRHRMFCLLIFQSPRSVRRSSSIFHVVLVSDVPQSIQMLFFGLQKSKLAKSPHFNCPLQHQQALQYHLYRSHHWLCTFHIEARPLL